MAFEYSVVIRTLGLAGKYYQQTLDSLLTQTIQPKDIIVYIAGGYPIPKETIGIERYVYVKKGMVSQRALPFDEIESEYILFLDDDVFLPSDAVENLYRKMVVNDGDVISPCTFENHRHQWGHKIRLALTGKELFRILDNRWGFKVMRTAGFSYNNNPKKEVYESQTNAGPCFFCKKKDFLKIEYQDEMWLDETFYALPDDQVMFYKMYKMGLKVLTVFNSGIIHLDASSTIKVSAEKTNKLVYSEYRNKLIFWHRFIYLPSTTWFEKISSVLIISYAYGLQYFKALILQLKGEVERSRFFVEGVQDALKYLKSDAYKSLKKV